MVNTTVIIVVVILVLLIVVGLGLGLGLYFGLRNRNNSTNTTNTVVITGPTLSPGTSSNLSFSTVQTVTIPSGQKVVRQTSTTNILSYGNYWTFTVQIPNVSYVLQVASVVSGTTNSGPGPTGPIGPTGSTNGLTFTTVNSANQVYLGTYATLNGITGSTSKAVGLFYWSATPASQMVTIVIPVSERNNQAYTNALVDPINLVTLTAFTVYYLKTS